MTKHNKLSAPGPDSSPGASVRPNCRAVAAATPQRAGEMPDMAQACPAPPCPVCLLPSQLRRQQDAPPEAAPLRRHDDRIYRLWDELADFGPDAASKP